LAIDRVLRPAAAYPRPLQIALQRHR